MSDEKQLGKIHISENRVMAELNINALRAKNAKRQATCDITEAIEASQPATTPSSAMASLVKSFKLDFTVQLSLLPHGIVNPSNWCYVLAPLQSLFNTTPFSNLMMLLAPERDLSSSLSPLPAPALKAMVATASHYRACRPGTGFEPSDMIAMLLRQSTFPVVAGRQEDSEEFLSFVLNSMHEEFGKISSNSNQLIYKGVSPIQVMKMSSI